MSKELFRLLDNQVRLRDWSQDLAAMNEMAQIYEGVLPPEYEKFFPKNTPKHLVQVIPLAWDDLATQAGRLPDLRGEPRNMNRSELRAIGLQEKIGFSYLRNAKPTGKSFMKQLAWWLQVGRAVAIVTPDFKTKAPRFELRDPRTCYPGIKEMANNTIIELSDLIFKYDLDHEEAQKRGLANPQTREGDGFRNRFAGEKVTVIEYIDDKQWYICSEDGYMTGADHNLGLVPGYVFQSFTPNSKAGKSRFKDQIAIMVAISRLITAKIAFADRLIQPILWARGHEGTIEIGPATLNKLGPNGEIGQINPPNQLQVDQDIQMLNQFSRILNRNPEARQGEIAAKGQYTSAKTIEQLADAIDTVIGSDWDIIGPGMEYLFKCGFTMDVKLWPDVEKTINGRFRGKRFLDSYVPKDDIGDRVDIRVDYGFGVGGYQGFLMHLQAKDAKTMSTRRAMEAMPGVTDVDEEMNLIDIEDMDAAGKALFQQQAMAGQMDMVLWAKLRKEMAEKGTPLNEAILKYQEELAAQATAAVGADQAALTTPPGPEEQMGAPQQMPGIPPSVLAGVA